MRKFYATAYTGKSPSASPKYWLTFTAIVPPLGFSTYVISSGQLSYGRQTGAIEVGSGNLKLIYSKDGKLTRYVNGRNAVNISVEQSYSYYKGSTDYDQASGAYIFRPDPPDGSFPANSDGKIPLKVLRGPLFDEVHQTFNSWIYQITRVYKEKEHAEIQFRVGPIPIEDYNGKETVSQIKTQIANSKTFYTDSNGRDFLKRIRDYRADWNLHVNQPIAGNYYPINLGIYIKDKKTELSVLVDRSVGGSSVADGEVEIMLHRRLIRDDGRGVDETLNEEVPGKYYLRFDPLSQGSKWRHSFGQEVYSPLLLAFSEQLQDDKWTNFPIPTFSAMDPSYSLPENVAIITLQELEDRTVLLRLAHLYEVGEDKDLSAVATVELNKAFPNKKCPTSSLISTKSRKRACPRTKSEKKWKRNDYLGKSKPPTQNRALIPEAALSIL